ncbi:MAG: exodeoxyribonuclease VII small subunit [Bacilli bacterium]|jgi:exodeoxyribonuclease VII small subunit
MVKKEISFEEKLKQLEKIVRELESGDVNLDDAIDKFNEAMKLAKECSDKLTNIEQQVNKILTNDDKLVDFDLET